VLRDTSLDGLEGEEAAMIEPLDDDEQEHLRRTIGLRCRRARLRLGLSQRKLADVMRRSPSWVREIERGDQYAPPYLTKVLAQALGVSVAWLYGEDDLPRLVAAALSQLKDARGGDAP
jgi:transcriptional regulator with XRE-family HTH domain